MINKINDDLGDINEISINLFKFDLFDKKVHLVLPNKYVAPFSSFLKKLNNFENWDETYNNLLYELIVIDTTIIDPIKVKKILNSLRYISLFNVKYGIHMDKIKEYFLIEKRNKIIENILKN